MEGSTCTAPVSNSMHINDQFGRALINHLVVKSAVTVCCAAGLVDFLPSENCLEAADIMPVQHKNSAIRVWMCFTVSGVTRNSVHMDKYQSRAIPPLSLPSLPFRSLPFLSFPLSIHALFFFPLPPLTTIPNPFLPSFPSSYNG